jgi:tetratricopeptide (TPR) repeat protein
LTVNIAGPGHVETFRDRLTRLREAAGLTKSALAAPGYTLSYVSQIESGRRTPSPDALAYFADRLGVSIAYLRSGIPDDVEERLSYLTEEGRATLIAGDPSRALELARSVASEGHGYGLGHVQARALVLAGDSLLIQGRARESIDRYEEALEIESGLTDRERGLATGQLAIAYRTVGDLSYAADLVESTLRSYSSTPLDPGVNAELHNVLLSVYFERGDVTKAERIAQRALDAAAEGVSPRTRANVMWSASRVYAESKRWDEALDLAREARLIIEGLDDPLRLARIHTAYAYICLEGDPPRLDEAGQHLDQAERILGADGPDQELAYVYTERGRLALLSNHPADALADSERALARVTDRGHARAVPLPTPSRTRPYRAWFDRWCAG